MTRQLPFENTRREILTKKKAETSDKYGCEPDKRDVKQLLDLGIINLDKTKGPTSHQVSAYVQKIIGVKKGGHSGTLDPKVTGVLPVAVGKATRIVQTLLVAGKEYICLMHLHKEAPEKDIREVMEGFIGTITQLPPLKSAVKRQVRDRKIYYIEILDIIGKDVLFVVGCQAGTYIRKLCLHPQTMIITKEGLVAASEFFVNHPKVYSLSKGKIVEKNPSAVQKLPSPSKMIRITMSSGISFTVTPDHEMLTSTKKGYEMIEAASIRKGDYLVKSVTFPDIGKELYIPDLLDDNYLISQPDIKDECKKAFLMRYKSIRAMNRKLKLDRKAFLEKADNAITIRHLKLAGIYEKVKRKIHTYKTQKGKVIRMKKADEDLFYLLGLVASDGNNTKEKKTERYTRIKFHNKDETIICRFLEKHKRLFPDIPITKKGSKDLIELDTANSFLATIAASLGIKSPQKDSDISPVINVSLQLIRAFLKGYFDGDGSAYYKKRPGTTTQDSYIRLHTGNPKDAVNLHKMLLKTGIPNRIFTRKSPSGNKKRIMHDVAIETLAGKKRFIKEIGSNHPFKLERFQQIMHIKDDSNIDDQQHIGFHYKEELRKNKSRLNKLGGNLQRVLNSRVPVTRKLYRNAAHIVKLPPLDDFIIERIQSVEKVRGSGHVYDMTVPGTHNFLIETGFVSSNCHDIGKSLGTGAHMAELRRTKAGPFNESSIVTLHDLTDAMWYWREEGNEKPLRHVVQPVENAVAHLPKVWVVDSAVDALCHGADLAVPGVSKLESGIEPDSRVAVMTLKDELVALGRAKMTTKNIINKDKGIAVKTRKVFMEPGTYPKMPKKEN